jgi:hypothetical protein
MARLSTMETEVHGEAESMNIACTSFRESSPRIDVSRDADGAAEYEPATAYPIFQ